MKCHKSERLLPLVKVMKKTARKVASGTAIETLTSKYIVESRTIIPTYYPLSPC